MKNKTPKKETKSGKEWLQGHSKGWEDFASFARLIRGPKTNGQGARGTKPSRKAVSINDEQCAKVIENTSVANVEQANRIADKAIDVVLKSNGGKDAEIHAIAMIYQMVGVLTDSKDPAYQSLAGDLKGIINDFEAVRAAEEARLKLQIAESNSIN